MNKSKDRSSHSLLTNVLNWSRRRFLSRIGTTGTAAYLTSSSVVVANALTSNVALADELSVLDQHVSKAMLAMARRLYPHDHLGDEYYWVVVEGIDKEIARDPELAARVTRGFADLQAATGGEFSELNTVDQIAAMTEIENTPFFADMLNKTTSYFYNNPAVWPHFGYEGSSWEKGGYINRGFDDADWIPDS